MFELSFANNTLKLSGNIYMNNAAAVCSQGRALMKPHARISVDLSEVENADSSLLAVLVDWLRHAKLDKRELKLTKVSTKIMALARVCSLDTILPIENK